MQNHLKKETDDSTSDEDYDPTSREVQNVIGFRTKVPQKLDVDLQILISDNVYSVV